VTHGALLETRSLWVRFGSVTAVDNVDMVAEAGRICGVIGPNGSARLRFWTQSRASFGAMAISSSATKAFSDTPRARRAAWGFRDRFKGVQEFLQPKNVWTA
jgi:ABC-type branched-subunit amino acid transport system ATPase component